MDDEQFHKPPHHDLAHHAAIGEDYDVALFIHNMREKTGHIHEAVNYMTLSNFLSNECYQEVHRVALTYATKATIAHTRNQQAQCEHYHELDRTMCKLARKLRNNAWKAQFIKEYMECFVVGESPTTPLPY